MITFNQLAHGILKRMRYCLLILKYPASYSSLRSFVKQLNRKANDFAMKRTIFRNPSGATARSRISPQDLLLLGIRAIEIPEIVSMWSTTDCLVNVTGPRARTIQVKNTVLKAGFPIMGDYLLGGKSGSWGEDNKAHLFLCRISGRRILLSVLAKNRFCFEHVYEIGLDLCHLTKREPRGPFLNELILNKGGYVGWDEESRKILFKHNAKRQYLPASTTKIMTALTALEINPEMSGYITVHPLDITSGSGSAFYPGDTLSFRDALYVMMLESSNTMANAVARTAGSLLTSRDTFQKA